MVQRAEVDDPALRPSSRSSVGSRLPRPQADAVAIPAGESQHAVVRTPPSCRARPVGSSSTVDACPSDEEAGHHVGVGVGTDLDAPVIDEYMHAHVVSMSSPPTVTTRKASPWQSRWLRSSPAAQRAAPARQSNAGGGNGGGDEAGDWAGVVEVVEDAQQRRCSMECARSVGGSRAQ